MLKRFFRTISISSLMIALAACGTSYSYTADLLETELEEKYNKDFVISSIGGRNSYTDDTTAYMYAANEPELIFTAKITPEGNVSYDNYAYRLVCRKAENVVNDVFERFDISSECFAAFDVKNSNIPTDLSVNEYIEQEKPHILRFALIVTSDSEVTGGVLEDVCKDISDEIPDITIGLSLYVLESEDFENISEKIVHRTEYFDASDLILYRIVGRYSKCYIEISNGVLSMNSSEIDAILRCKY